MRKLFALLTLVVLFALNFACDRPTAAPPGIPPPPADGVEPWVATALREAHDQVAAAPTAARSWTAYAELLDAHRRTTAAATCYRQAIELAPGDFRARYLLARVLALDGNPEAAAAFEAALQLRGRDVPALLGYGEALLRFGRAKQARVPFEAVLGAGGDATAFACRGLGQILRDEGRTDEAIALLERGRAAAPRFGELASLLAALYAKAGRPDDAERSMAAARALPSAYPAVDPLGDEVQAKSVSSSGLSTAARALLDAGRREEAGAKLRQLLGHLPDHLEARMTLALTLAGAGELTAARVELEEVVRRHPDHANGHLKLARLLALAGERERCLLELQAAARLPLTDAERADLADLRSLAAATPPGAPKKSGGG